MMDSGGKALGALEKSFFILQKELDIIYIVSNENLIISKTQVLDELFVAELEGAKQIYMLPGHGRHAPDGRHGIGKAA